MCVSVCKCKSYPELFRVSLKVSFFKFPYSFQVTCVPWNTLIFCTKDRFLDIKLNVIWASCAPGLCHCATPPTPAQYPSRTPWQRAVQIVCTLVFTDKTLTAPSQSKGTLHWQGAWQRPRSPKVQCTDRELDSALAVQKYNTASIRLSVCMQQQSNFHTGEFQYFFKKTSNLVKFGQFVRFEVSTAVTMKNGVFWDVTPCGCCNNRRCGGT
jgi:hypothetical protein